MTAPTLRIIEFDRKFQWFNEKPFWRALAGGQTWITSYRIRKGLHTCSEIMVLDVQRQMVLLESPCRITVQEFRLSRVIQHVKELANYGPVMERRVFNNFCIPQ